MIFDFSSPGPLGIFVLPEQIINPQVPVNPSNIKETIILDGSSTTSSVQIIGTTDTDQACTCN